MSDMKTRTLGRKNVRGLVLSAPQKIAPAPSAGDAQIPGALGNNVARADTLEIGVEFKLDFKTEDLIVLKELGAGNGGTVSKVMHAATKVIMAKKVILRRYEERESWLNVVARSSTWKRRKMFESK